MGCNASQLLLNSSDEIARLKAADTLSRLPHVSSRLPDLRSSIDGTVLHPIDDAADYHEAQTRPYNKDFRGYPLLIIRPKHATDVVKCVDFIREHAAGVKLCVACGMHSNRCMLDDSIVLDLFQINTIVLSDDQSRIEVGGGCYLEDVDKAMAPFGLGVPIGSYPWTGVGGLVLAGGYGWLSRKYGLSVDNLEEVEAVLADGRLVTANNHNEFADLIWGFRGGGGNFGIVTKFTFRTHRLPPTIFGGSATYLTPTHASAVQVLKNFDALVQTLEDNITPVAVLPAGAPVVPTAWAYYGDDAKTKVSDVKPLTQIGSLGGWVTLENSVGPTSYHKNIQRLTSSIIKSGRVYTSLVQIGCGEHELPIEFFDELLQHVRRKLASTLKVAVVILFRMGGKISNPDEPDRTCLDSAVRTARYFAIVEAMWHGKSGDQGRDDAREWVRESCRILGKQRAIVMRHAPDCFISHDDINIATTDQQLTDLASDDLGYQDSVLDRLRRLKGKYDPSNFFRQNSNIIPMQVELVTVTQVDTKHCVE